MGGLWKDKILWSEATGKCEEHTSMVEIHLDAFKAVVYLITNRLPYNPFFYWSVSREEVFAAFSQTSAPKTGAPARIT